MSGNPFKKISPMESVLMIFVVLLLILFCIFLVRNIQMAHRRGIFSHGPSVSDILLKNRQSNRISIADADSIEAWMTFRYINFIFSIPENSFRDQLQIADNAYPNVTL